ncbi:MAG TPA: adenylosuccinate lyase [Bdellovibrionales bacterium]|nr:adenylosuccinate lyase [Bdellovibrionales bacterium]
MIARYTRPEMARVWEPEARFAKLLEVEIAVAAAQAELGIIPKDAAKNIAKKGKFSVSEIDEIERETKHDVIAFVTNVASYVGDDGKYVHYGMTSSDVLDTAMSLLLKEAAGLLNKSLDRFENALVSRIKEHKSTVCVGRTHGIHAEPTTFGWKLAGHLAELRRNRGRFERAINQALICKLSGPVGTYSTQEAVVEEKVAQKLGLRPETVATQVVPRDRHAEVFMALTFLTTGFERLAVEIRHLQRTEVGEVEEGFSKGQKGSSAMPHKKNPIGSENITGLARLVRANAMAAFENVVLWHERDISHSSVERVIFPDAFIVTDFAADRLAGILENLVVREDRMKRNLELTSGQILSSQILLALVRKGLSREDAYKIVQKASHSLKEGDHLRDKLFQDKSFAKLLSKKEVDEIFSGRLKQVSGLVDKILKRSTTNEHP